MSDFVGIEILLDEVGRVGWIVAIRICDGAFAIVPEKKASEMQIVAARSFVTLENRLDEITECFLSWNQKNDHKLWLEMIFIVTFRNCNQKSSMLKFLLFANFIKDLNSLIK